jgi:hypothetical protein
VRNSEPADLIATSFLNILLWFVPVSIGVAILRSRLWDIDVLINRALVYGSLSALLAALYFGVVVGLHSLATALTHQTKPWAVIIVASTLLIATLVQPLRQGLQRGIDRRFYRRKYDAARTLANFGAALRTETDLDQISAHWWRWWMRRCARSGSRSGWRTTAPPLPGWRVPARTTPTGELGVAAACA